MYIKYKPCILCIPLIKHYGQLYKKYSIVYGIDKNTCSKLKNQQKKYDDLVIRVSHSHPGQMIQL